MDQYDLFASERIENTVVKREMMVFGSFELGIV